MKGTLFSADFVKDSEGNLRLLELNTDTGFISNTLNTRFDFSDFKTVLSDNNITTLVIIYKQFQQEFVDLLVSDIETNATFITTITKQLEDTDTIYPSSVTNASDKFILRLAYDENALFDSTYCKQRANLQKIFYDNSATGSIPQFYYSGSEYEVNTISSDINGHDVLPDFIVKDKSEGHRPLTFIKLGNSSSSSLDRVNDFVNNYHNKEGQTLERYHYNTSDLSDNKISGYRKYSIVYGVMNDVDGTNIYTVGVGGYRVESFFDLPTTSSIDYITDNSLKNIYSNKHYFELTSNYIRTKGKDEGIYGQEVLITSADGEVLSSAVSQSDSLKSMFINGLPDTDDSEVYRQWYSTGSDLPSGSYVTSSIVETITTLDADNYGIIGEITLDNNEKIYSTTTKHFLTYSTGSDEFRFVQQYKIASDDHFLVDANGNKINISDNNILILEDNETGSLYRIDVETTDSYFVSSSQSPFIVHNAPCFAAGTKISILDGEKNIEDVIVGDEVWTYNHETDENELNRVLQVMVKDWEETVEYTLSDGMIIKATPDHPFWVVELNDYASHNPAATLSDSGLEVQQIQVGHTLQHIDSNPDDSTANITISSIEVGETQAVYNLNSVEKNSNFYANGVLVHNRFIMPCCFVAGTQIKLANGKHKNIEDIVVGDEVLAWGGETPEPGEHKDVLVLGEVTELHPTILGDRKVYSINGKIDFTSEHPFYTKDGWKALECDTNRAPFLEEEPKVLQIGDEIYADGEWETIETIEVNENYTDSEEKVYNFSVKDYHTYIANGILVHNK